MAKCVAAPVEVGVGELVVCEVLVVFSVGFAVSVGVLEPVAGGTTVVGIETPRELQSL